MPDLPIPDDPAIWTEFVRKTANVSYRGISLRRLLRNIPSQQATPLATPGKITDVEADPEDAPTLEAVEAQGIILEPRFLQSAAELEEFVTGPTIMPVIIVVDLGIVEKNRKWGQHAVLLHSIDLKHERKIYVIDPMNTYMKEPSPLDLRRFELGWKECSNTTILVYPKNYATIISTIKRDSVKLTDFMGDG